MSSVLRQRQSLMFRPRSYTAFAIAPQPPLQDWLADLDVTLERSKGFFSGHPVALDLSAVNLSPAAISELVADLEKRNICVLGVEGIDPAKWQSGFPHSSRRTRHPAVRSSIKERAWLCDSGCSPPKPRRSRSQHRS